MKKYAEEKRNEYLFINIRLAWLDNYINKPEELSALQWAHEFGISLDRIVIEITEEEFNIDEAHINVASYYKKAGCRIALDDYGKNDSNIDRIALLQPDIIKINMDYTHKSEKSHIYREYLKYLSRFAEAEKLGSARLLEYGTSADMEKGEIPDSFVGYAAMAFTG